MAWRASVRVVFETTMSGPKTFSAWGAIGFTGRVQRIQLLGFRPDHVVLERLVCASLFLATLRITSLHGLHRLRVDEIISGTSPTE